jgi:spore germination protein YaaH
MPNSQRYGYAVALFLLLASVGATIAETATWCVSAWYPSSSEATGKDSLLNNLAHVDVVHPFWYTPNADHTLQAVRGAEDESLLQAWREAGVLVIPSIFASIPTMLNTPETRRFHVGEIVALVERMGYDGIDIDYEGFPRGTREAFTAFIAELSTELRARDKWLAIAVHGKTDDAGSWDGAGAQDWNALAPLVDIFSVMTYDYTNRNEPPGAIAPTGWVLDVLAYAESVMPLDKVRVGLHFYGYSWLRDKPPATTITWEAAQRLISSFGLAVTRDPNDLEARIEFKAQGLPKQTLYFADAVHLADKLARIQAQFPTLGGVAIWGIGGEDPQNWDILQGARTSPCLLTKDTDT